ncbi:MAG TPA: hypothetical protein VLA71_05735 [Algoriphagus sp.]|nr:hypothetical protein [Algoriphagus sp.]
MYNINFKLFTIPFYRNYLGFWILVLVFGGIFMELKQHILLGKFLFNQPLAFSILPIGFILFSTFHLTFQLRLLRGHEYHFYHQTGLLSRRILGKNWAIVWLSTHVFPIIYLIFLSYFGVEKQTWDLLAILWISVVSGCLINLIFIYNSLLHPLKETVLVRPKWNWPLPRISWFGLELRQNRPLLLLLTKTLSIVLLNGFFISYQTGTYDLRWLEFGILCIAYLHIPILLEKNEFENQKLSWFRSLPLPLFEKVLNHLGSLAIVLLPELIFLFWRSLQLGKMEFVLILPLNLISILVGLLGLIYWKTKEFSIIRFSIGAFFLIFLSILFAVPWVILVVGFTLFFFSQIRSPYQV